MSKTILVPGATGQISSGMIPHLKGSGATLRALVRDRQRAASLVEQGVEVVEGDLGLPRTRVRVCSGCDAVGTLTPPGPRAPEQSSNALWAARRGGARHVVRMSAI